VFVDQLVYGFGRCCAEKRGLIIHRYRLAARPQAGETLLDHLPEKEDAVAAHPAPEPFLQVRIDVTGLDPEAAHRAIVEHAHAMISDPTGEFAAAYPNGITAATDDAYRGLIGILERHAPLDLGANGIRCSRCPADAAPAGWPCPDYRDAARGLAAALPSGDR
jgi:hypothetical protein